MSKKPVKTIDISEEYGKNNSLKAFLHIIYAIFALSMFIGGLPLILAVILAYFKRGDSIDTLYESHYDYLIKTFWLLLSVIILALIAGAIVLLITAILIFPMFLAWILIPILIAVITIWFLYRIIKGWLCLLEEREIPESYL